MFLLNPDTAEFRLALILQLVCVRPKEHEPYKNFYIFINKYDTSDGSLLMFRPLVFDVFHTETKEHNALTTALICKVKLTTV